MDENEENTGVDDFAFVLLRRAKEREEKLGRPETQQNGQAIDKMMEKLEKRTSTTSIERSPEKLSSSLASPQRSSSRSILKPISNSEDNDASELTDFVPKKKSVSTCDALTGHTIVEAKTFCCDDTGMDMDMDVEEDDDEFGESIDYLPQDDNEEVEDKDKLTNDKIESNEDGSMPQPRVETTPLLTKTLKKLTEFHSNEEIDSPVHAHTPLEALNYGGLSANNDVSYVSASRNARTSRLSALARTINEWEDDTTHHDVPGSRFSESNPKASLAAGRPRFGSAASPSASSPLGVGANKGQIHGVRLFHKASKGVPKVDIKVYNKCSRNSQVKSSGDGDGQYPIIKNINQSSNKNGCASVENSIDRLGFEHTILTKLQNKIARQNPCNQESSEISECWDEALMKSLELQGFSRRQASPQKQLKEKVPLYEESDEETESVPRRSPEAVSPKKTYFGESPPRGTPKRQAPSPPKNNAEAKSPNKTYFGDSPTKKQRAPSPPQSPSKSPMKIVNHGSPTKSASPVVRASPQKYSTRNSGNMARRSPSPTKSASPVKQIASSSPLKYGGKSSSNESTPSGKPVSAIRMRFEGSKGISNVGPAKPERSRGKPYSTPVNRTAQSSSSPVKKFHFGEADRDPSTLSVAERAKMFEGSNFYVASRKPVVVSTQPKKPAIFTSSPCLDNVKPHEIDISSVMHVEAVKRPVARASPTATSKYPAPPPPPPLPNTSTPTNANAKRRSTSPARQFPVEHHSVKRIKVNAPKPGKIYPSLTDIDTETETEAEGHCSEGESVDDSIESEQSLGAEIETIAKAYSPIRQEFTTGARAMPRYRPSEDFSDTFACATVDALIDEALEGQLDGTTINSTAMFEAGKIATASHACDDVNANSDEDSEERPFEVEQSQNKTQLEEASYSEAETTASSSFATSPVTLSNYSALAANRNAQSQNSLNVDTDLNQKQETYKSPVRLETNITEEPEEEEYVPRQLMHTVSFYRKQQQQQKKVDVSSALNEICEQSETSDDSITEAAIEKPNLGEIIRQLEDEANAHTSSIAQASKALNLCKALVGFSESTELIECERILLIETQRRLALLNSIHRLKTEGALSRQLPNVFSPSKQEVTPSSKGNMNISDISVILRRDFFNARRAECQYHFICLIKNKHQVEHTNLLTYDSQKNGSTLRFGNEFRLQNLEPDFQVNIEVYYLETAKEYLPHEAKYRINAKKDSKQSTLLSPLLTPSKKSGKGDASSKLLTRPQIRSPAGPETIKTSNFKFCGTLSIDISSLQRTNWELQQVAGPLSGGIDMKVKCSAVSGVEYKGFLTLFDDVSGYGAWQRRWCRLGPSVLEFWKYPEDEAKKAPLETVNLHDCVTSKVRPAPREVCARANTLLLVTTRAPHPDDKDTLVLSCQKGYTAIRHLISADTRADRDSWCHQLNKALANLRAWDPVAHQSVDDSVF